MLNDSKLNLPPGGERRISPRARRSAAIAGLAVLLAHSFCVDAAEPVTVELFVPPARTRVIGDVIPLHWRFHNSSSQALAFMWEGCCRVNGRVEMTRLGAPPPPAGFRPSHAGVGPGIYNPACLHCRLARQQGELTVNATPQGPATAHLFARAVKLEPGKTQEFISPLENWVLLEHTGDYRLRGNYLGVHPVQQPQMPKGTELWSGRASTPSIDLSLLTVSDYLAEGPARAAAGGLQLFLSGPPEVLPFGPARFQLTITNLSATNQTVHLPGQAGFWLVDDQGRRVPESRFALGSKHRLLEIASRRAEHLEIPITHDLLEGRPFGSYRAFVEFTTPDRRLRIPSNPVSMLWRLDAGTVRELIRQAADLPGVGSRNPQLKLLRTHLAELRPALRAIPATGLSAAATALLTDLLDAATLKPLQPAPGIVELHLRVPAAGPAHLEAAVIHELFPPGGPPLQARLERVVSLRRHLGWTIQLAIRVEDQAPLSSLKTALASIAPVRAQLGGPPVTRLFTAAATGFSRVNLHTDPVPASLVLSLTRSQGRLTVGQARKAAPPGATGSERFFTAGEIGGLTFQPVPGPDGLTALLNADDEPAPSILLLAHPEISWHELTRAVAPVLARGLPLDLQVR